ncbi:MAG: 2-phosphosulfolactate phosphatase [Bacteroidales bacterium]|nr:2-phosphosulfolactate phosphatase [Bacteroidales bacterium]
MNKIEVCLSPKLFDNYTLENKIVVIVDVLRATTIITTMFQNGLYKLIPVKTLDEAKELKEKGFLVAAERNGKKVDFADFDNSPYTFTPEKIGGKTLVYSTTNGTNTINLAKKAKSVILASFLNITEVSNYLSHEQKDVLILCSGWQGDFCTEDSIFAGALSEKLLQNNFISNSDSVNSSIELWNLAKKDLSEYIKTMYQYKRLMTLGMEKIIGYCFKIDVAEVIPVLKGDYIIDLKKIPQF